MAKGNPVFGAAVLKLTLHPRLAKDPGARELYEGALRDLGVNEADVERYIEANRPALEAAMTRAPAPRADGGGKAGDSGSGAGQ